MAKILLIEDDPVLSGMFAEILDNEGYLVIVAGDGETGLRWIEESLNPDLVLLDIGLPDMSGIEVCKQIKDNFRTREIPIIVLTAFTENKVKIDSEMTGRADLFLNKPIDVKDLLKAVEGLILRSEKEKKLKKMRMGF